jgi:hypothetical protein
VSESFYRLACSLVLALTCWRLAIAGSAKLLHPSFLVASLRRIGRPTIHTALIFARCIGAIEVLGALLLSASPLRRSIYSIMLLVYFAILVGVMIGGRALRRSTICGCHGPLPTRFTLGQLKLLMIESVVLGFFALAGVEPWLVTPVVLIVIALLIARSSEIRGYSVSTVR